MVHTFKVRQSSLWGLPLPPAKSSMMLGNCGVCPGYLRGGDERPICGQSGEKADALNALEELYVAGAANLKFPVGGCA